ncbi:MAG TPA: histidine phosphatase family protein [Pseudonocardia sp.]|jgi:probable phosphoglycerate mutase|nr:histidine phosphatase family protein [Pseudonocardia sp.]
MARLILVRHAESEANVAQVATSRPPGPPLSPHGEKQAEALADRLADEGVVAIRTSNTLRARATARPLAERLGIVPSEHEDLIEISCGDFDGVAGGEAFSEVVRVYDAWFSGERDEIIRGGETYYEVERRMLRALPRADEIPPDGAAVVVAHGGSLRVVVAALAGDDAAAGSGYLDNSAHVTLEVGADGGWRLAEIEETHGVPFGPDTD